MLQCKSCGAFLSLDDLFCGQCGHVADETKEVTNLRDQRGGDPQIPFTPPPLTRPSNSRLPNGEQSQWSSSTPPPLRRPSNIRLPNGGPDQQVPHRGTPGSSERTWLRPDMEEYYPTIISGKEQAVDLPFPTLPMAPDPSSMRNSSPSMQGSYHVALPPAPPVTPVPELGNSSVWSWSPTAGVPEMQPVPPHSPLSPTALWPPEPPPSFFRKHIRKLGVIAVASILIISSVIGFLLIQQSKPQHQPVVSKPARLVVSSPTLDFGKLEQGVKEGQAVEIGNTGGQRLIWTADVGNTPWLTVLPKTAGIEPGGPQQSDNVTIDTSHLPLGANSAQLVIRSKEGGNFVVTVKVVVIPRSAKKQPILNLSAGGFDLGTLTAGMQRSLALTLSNVGTQTLSWQASKGNSPWLGVDKTKDTIESGGQPETIHLTVNTIGLQPGPYRAALNIISNGGNQKVSISLVVNAPPNPPTQTPAIMTVSPSLLNFGPLQVNTLTPQQVEVSNNGGTSLIWRADKGGTSWLKLDIPSGTIQSGSPPQFITVTVDTTGLQAGVQSATLTFSSNGGKQAITVTMNVLPTPSNLCGLASTLSFPSVLQGHPESLPLTFNNCGGQLLKWTASNGGASWLSLDGNATSSGVLDTNQPPASINVQVDTSQLQAQVTPYQATILFSTNEPNGGHEPVVVSVRVLPCWSVAPSSLNFTVTAGDATSSQKQLTVNNCGTLSLTWSAQPDSSSSSWLSVDNTGPVSPGGSAPINVTVNPASLSAGSYPATVTVSTSGSTKPVAVPVTAVPPTPTPACLQVPTTNNLSFTVTAGTASSPQKLTVTNCSSTQSLTWTATQSTQPAGSNWLSIDNAGTTTSPGGSATITVSIVNGASLTAGTPYTGTITISATGATGSPVTVNITLTVS